MKIKMKEYENEVKNAYRLFNNLPKFKTISEAIATKGFISDYQKTAKRNGNHTFRELNNICVEFLKNGCSTKEELRLKDLAEDYTRKYKAISKICSTICAYEKNDFLLGYTKEDYKEEILRFRG